MELRYHKQLNPENPENPLNPDRSVGELGYTSIESLYFSTIAA